MLSKPTCRDAADQLLLAAAALERPGRDVAVESLPDDLEELGEALRAAESALATSGVRVVPAAARSDHGASRRYQRAAAMWPTDPPPSYERFAAALAQLHDTAAAMRRAADRCDEAKRTVNALLRTSARRGAA